MNTFPLRSSLLSAAISIACQSQAASDPHHPIVNEDAVITVTAPLSNPLNVVTSPKTPRQPVPASDGSDYLKTIPGFAQVRNGGTNGDPVFRGMFGSRLRILTDGGEMPGACPARMDAPTSYISPESFDLLSITKGPQTVLWGPGNSAGTIRFERQPPQFKEPGIKGDASLLAASNHRYDQNADLSLGSEQGYLRLLGNKSRSDDYKDGNGDRVASRWDKWNADIALGWTPDADTLLELSAGRGNGEARYAGRSMDGSQFKRESLGLRFEKSNIGEVLDKVEAQIYYNYADHIMDNITLRSPTAGMGSMSGMAMGGMDMSSGMTARLDRRTVGGRAMATLMLGDVKLESGMDMQTSTHRRRSGDDWSKDARFHDVGMFSELSWSASEQDKIVGGARLDRTWVDNFSARGEGERSNTLPAGFMRLEHTLNDVPLMLYAGVGYTERFPDYWELFSPTTGADGLSAAFDTVKPEKTTQLDFGAMYSGEHLDGWLSAYVGRVNDFILFNYDADNSSLSRASNVDATIMGAEAGYRYQLTEHWSTDASLAWAWGKNRSDNTALPQMPPLDARLGLGWENGPFSTSALLRMVSHQDRIALNQGNVVGKDFGRSAGFSIFSANAAWQFNPQLKLSAGVDNIFNQAYSEHLNLAGNSSFGYSSNTPVNEPGRTWWAKVNVKF
ncbi:TonB-dependent copper receptor [Pantoea coffeiphila]|uniref:TonB-dependent copper receptor n=1 Tax=Pantoea coffeiphila TaxID=1465635 RepID=A0A2S9I6R0_9GAMM|nr:TonB-dependent copper receptor [Pantoea coffeiphila]PRD13470.1 TonB-dependent copper receptor [Pantoea coffeiphila]